MEYECKPTFRAPNNFIIEDPRVSMSESFAMALIEKGFEDLNLIAKHSVRLSELILMEIEKSDRNE